MAIRTGFHASQRATANARERDQWRNESQRADANIKKLAKEIASLRTEKERIEALHAEVIGNANTLRRQRDQARLEHSDFAGRARADMDASYAHLQAVGDRLSEVTENEQKWMEESRHKQDQLTILGNEFLGMANKRDEAVKEIELLRKNVSRSDRKAARLEKELKKARKTEEARS